MPTIVIDQVGHIRQSHEEEDVDIEKFYKMIFRFRQVACLNLSVRATHALRRNKLMNLGDLEDLDWKQWIRQVGIGRKTLDEVHTVVLKEWGIDLQEITFALKFQSHIKSPS